MVRAGGARRKLLIFLVLVIGGVAVLPYVVAKTPLRNALLAKAVPGGVVRLSATDASLSWISGPSLSGVAVVDATGGPLIAAEQISLARAPLKLLLNSRDLGVITIARPTIYLKARRDGSNLEDAVNAVTKALAPTSSPPAPESSTTSSATFAVNIVEGTILIDDAASSRQWRAEGVNVQLDNRGPSGGLSRVLLSGRIVEATIGASPVGGAEGRFSIAVEPVDGGRNQLTLQAEGVSLAIAEPWLRRFI
jgi:translocation and assembly module TamB